MRLKEKGNQLHSQGQTQEAIEAYGEAIQNASLAMRASPLMIQLYGNRAACHIVLESWEAAVADCGQVQELDPGNIKANLRCGTALIELKQLGEALNKFMAVKAVEKDCSQLKPYPDPNSDPDPTVILILNSDSNPNLHRRITPRRGAVF